MENLNQLLEQSVRELVNDKVKTYSDQLTKDYNEYLEKAKNEYLDSIKSGLKLNVTYNKVTSTIKGLKHRQLETLLKVLGTKQNVLMVGSAGTGKSHAVEQCADALCLDFYSMSLSPQTTKSDIFGYGDVNGNFVETPFYKAFSQGGIMLFDEIDAGNAGVLVAINSALSNGFTSFPIVGNVKRHKDFIIVGTANTYGFGADRQYVGRNQLDGATLDRFTIINWQIDEDLESKLAGDTEQNIKWLKFIRETRQYLNNNSVRAIVSPRAVIRGRDLINIGMPLDQVLELAVYNAIPPTSQSAVKDIFKTTFKGDL
jgi:cobaltochelatase CobS